MKHKKAINPKLWSPAELEILLVLYRQFLNFQLRGEKYQKAAAVRAVMAQLDRTRGSVEGKLMNISGCLVTLKASQLIVKGYAPTEHFGNGMLEPVKLSIVNHYLKKAA